MFPRLAERRAQRAGTMSGGERQMLAVGRALMSEPKLLLLDEPSLGLAPAIVETMYETFAALHKEGLTILLAEQSVDLALEVADYAYVLQVGRTVLRDRRTRWPTIPTSRGSISAWSRATCRVLRQWQGEPPQPGGCLRHMPGGGDVDAKRHVSRLFRNRSQSKRLRIRVASVELPWQRSNHASRMANGSDPGAGCAKRGADSFASRPCKPVKRVYARNR